MIYKNKRKKGITSMKMNLKNKITFNICVIVTLSLVVMCTSVSYTHLDVYKRQAADHGRNICPDGRLREGRLFVQTKTYCLTKDVRQKKNIKIRMT